MKRVLFYKPEDIRVEETDIPIPGPGEVVVRNKVTLTCGTDVKTYKRGYRYEPPFAMGHEASGIVHAVGKGVVGFKEGDRVVAHNSAPCNKCYFCKKGQSSMCRRSAAKPVYKRRLCGISEDPGPYCGAEHVSYAGRYGL